jgi:hypothetical protein
MIGPTSWLRLALLLSASLLGPQLPAQNTERIVHVGLVVTDKTNAYVSGAQIKVCPHGGKLPQIPQRYQPGTLWLTFDPGSYDLFVTSPVFKPWYKHLELREDSSETITAALEIAARTLVHTGHSWDPVSPPESLNIHVTDETGLPVAYAQVGGTPDSDAMETDDDGQLKLNLFPSTYLIAVTSPGYERWEKLVDSRAEDDVKVVLKRTDTLLRDVPTITSDVPNFIPYPAISPPMGGGPNPEIVQFPEVYSRVFPACSAERSCSRTSKFHVETVPKGCCLLTVTNGDGWGTDEVNSYEVFLNGKRVLGSGETRTEVRVGRNNALKVALVGKLYARLSVVITYDPREPK